MLFSQTEDRPVVSVADASTVGVVDACVVDPALARVVALRLHKTKDSKRNILTLARARAIGSDAVMVDDPEVLETAEGGLAELADKNRDLPQKRVLTDRGDELGSLTDVDFDPESGAVLTLHTTAGDLEGRALIGNGGYAVVVRADLTPAGSSTAASSTPSSSG
ncbi:hypothetical protein [Streptomyces sp. NPDC048639]|uniref:hypothetical protein n=1 Tax=Streptomyces sp. NPDC048639 TaxID=3365581 RepID=UPI0037189B4A